MRKNNPRFILDSYALLAFFRIETGGPRVRELLESAMRGDIALSMSTISLGEVFYRIYRELGVDQAHTALGRIREFAIEIVNVDEEFALHAARLKALHRMGYADCFVAALAERTDATIITGDRDFERVEGRIPIEWLPE